jgi:hypothetical protein
VLKTCKTRIPHCIDRLDNRLTDGGKDVRVFSLTHRSGTASGALLCLKIGGLF